MLLGSGLAKSPPTAHGDGVILSLTSAINAGSVPEYETDLSPKSMKLYSISSANWV
jgi:hypothetical protein